jgi:hypothetical protein
MRVKQMLRHPSRYLWILPGLAAWLGQRCLAGFPDLVERFHAQALFRWISWPIGFITSLLPFSLTEVLLIVGSPVLLVLLIIWLVRLIRLPGKWIRFGRLLRGMAWTASLAYLLFMLLHGLNYARLPVAASFDLPARERSAAELETVATWLAARTAELRALTQEDDSGVFILSSGIHEALQTGSLGYAAASAEYPLLAGGRLRPKGVLLSHYWSYTGITGLYMPLLVESNINIDQPDYSIPDTILHEMAHTRGFAREDEAGFLAFLAGIAHPDPDFAYSAMLATTVRSMNALYGVDKDAYNRVAGLLGDGAWRDLSAGNAYWKQFEGPVQETSNQVNNAYLQANLQDDGVKSYGRMVDLVLAWHEVLDREQRLDSAVAVLDGAN